MSVTKQEKNKMTVLVIGGSGSGKSSFAEDVLDLLPEPLLELPFLSVSLVVSSLPAAAFALACAALSAASH